MEMKNYIKPETVVFEAEPEQILAGSLEIEIPGKPGSKDPQEGAGKNHKLGSVLDFSWDDVDDDDDEN